MKIISLGPESFLDESDSVGACDWVFLVAHDGFILVVEIFDPDPAQVAGLS